MYGLYTSGVEPYIQMHEKDGIIWFKWIITWNYISNTNGGGDAETGQGYAPFPNTSVAYSVST